MLGLKKPQSKLFYGFCLEERIPHDHLLRLISRNMDFRFITPMVHKFYSHTGTPSVDPVVIFKMSLIGYLYGISSERRLAEECRFNMAFLWFLGYDIDEVTPDHSILTKARQRFGRETYEQFFAEIVRQCADRGLIQGRKLFMGSTLLPANAAVDKTARRALYQELSQTPDEYMDQVWTENEDSTDDRPPDLPPPATGREPRSNEYRVNTTGPDATLVHRKDRKLFYGYKVHVAVDGGEARIVTAVKTTTGTVRESQVAIELLDRHRVLTRMKPAEIVADKAYGTLDLYRRLRDADIMASIPKSKPRHKLRNKRLKAGFRYDAAKDMFICPKGKVMYRIKQAAGSTRAMYLVGRFSCRGCENRGRLCASYRPAITRPLEEDLLEWHSAHMSTPEARESLQQRRVWPETVFAEVKNARGLRQARLRRLFKVSCEGLMAMATHNVRQLARWGSKASAGAQMAASRVWTSKYAHSRFLPYKSSPDSEFGNRPKIVWLHSRWTKTPPLPNVPVIPSIS